MRNRGVAALACLAVVATADLVLSRKRPPWLLVGVFDEPAHLATAGVVLANLRPSSSATATRTGCSSRARKVMAASARGGASSF